MVDARAIAFYLPQFHPIAENDLWWEPGFTEWTNVTKGRPLFPGHYQPHLPGELGFYDLRLPEVREMQAALARSFGIEGFCYYHYWFHGRRLLERPFQEVLESGKPDFPFALCWANENWTRVWDGGEHYVLMPQSHSHDDDVAHLRWLARAFRDPRYIRVDGKPLFLVYRAGKLEDPRRTTMTWREEARRLGIGELYLCKVESFTDERDRDPAEAGFDASVEWIPDPSALGAPLFRSGLRPRLGRRIRALHRPVDDHSVFDYSHVVDTMIATRKQPAGYVRHPCVTPSWDNSARRRQGAMIFKDSTPADYARWLEHAVEEACSGKGEPLLFISAWNEWAEGNHLEPDARWGRAYLEATAQQLAERADGSHPSEHWPTRNGEGGALGSRMWT